MCNSNECSPAFAITILMADGRTDGVKVVKKANWDGVCVICPRGRYATVAKERDEFKRGGVYILLGDEVPERDEIDGSSQPKPKQQIYIGETESLRTRLKQQDDEKGFWRQVVVFTKQSDATPLNKATIKYLESRLQQIAEESGRCKVVKGKISEKPALSEEDEATVKGYLNEMLSLLAAVGVRVFEGVSQAGAQTKLYKYVGKDFNASGYETNDRKFVVRKGSIARGKTASSILAAHKRQREELIEENVLKKRGDDYYLVRDHEFGTPSPAASVFSGTSVNGRTAWKDESGETLGDNQKREAE